MTPQSPVIPGQQFGEKRIAEHQPEFGTLPAILVDNTHDDSQEVLTRWSLTWRERLTVLFFGDVYLWIFGTPIRPVNMQVERPDLRVVQTKWELPNGQQDEFILVRAEEVPNG